MWIQLLLILVIVVLALSVKEGYEDGDYRPDMFSSNECPFHGLKCLDKTKF
jgi:hypothetical protein